MSTTKKTGEDRTPNAGRIADVEPEFVAAMYEAGALSAISALSSRALKAGDHAPNFRLQDSEGNNFSLAERLKEGPVVVSFYRGDWCPYCNVELRRLAEKNREIEALGAALVAISPGYGEATNVNHAADDLPFVKLVDPGSKVARAYGVTFDVAISAQDLYTRYGMALPAVKDASDLKLPLPATYVIDQNSRIVLSFIDVDYRHRLEPEALVAALNGLKARSRSDLKDSR
jgi:peroxiredoxin